MPLPPPPPPSGDRGAAGLPQPPAGAAPSTGPSGSVGATCYRHADRPTGRRCTRCGKPACEQCLVQADVGSHCLDCAKASRPDIKTRAKFWSAGQPNLVTMSLIAVNVAVFLGVLVWTQDGGALAGQATDAHLDLGLSKDVLAFPIRWPSGTGVPYFTEPDGWYRLVTSGFMHFGLIHIGLNMYFLYILGPMLERPLGRVGLLALYAASLLGGSLGVLVLDSGGITAGASGAVFGLMAGASVGLWRRGVNPFSTAIGSTLLLNLFLTFFIPGISIGGHLGGAVAGAICGAVMLAPGHKPVPRWAVYATPVAVGIASVVLSVMIVNAA
ncbi:MAG: rhomboid family intramembrane serine protease [Ilumatobacter sp.]|nr:rhomboid family intramembrane serine protease [Ilumatobacter sp.]